MSNFLKLTFLGQWKFIQLLLIYVFKQTPKGCKPFLHLHHNAQPTMLAMFSGFTSNNFRKLKFTAETLHCCEYEYVYAQLCLTRDSTEPARFLCPCYFPGKNTEASCHFLLQEVFLKQGWTPHLLCLLHCSTKHTKTTAGGSGTWNFKLSPSPSVSAKLNVHLLLICRILR